jgi:hypothetical protein
VAAHAREWLVLLGLSWSVCGTTAKIAAPAVGRRGPVPVFAIIASIFLTDQR